MRALFLSFLFFFSYQIFGQNNNNFPDTNAVGINKDSPIENDLKIISHPATNTIHFRSEDEIEEIELIDLKGQLMLQIPDSDVDLREFTNGVYFYRVKMHGGKTVEGKFLKE